MADKPMIDTTKGEIDPDDGRKFYSRGDGSNVAETTRVGLTGSEQQELDNRGEVEVTRDRRTITISADTGVDVVYVNDP